MTADNAFTAFDKAHLDEIVIDGRSRGLSDADIAAKLRAFADELNPPANPGGRAAKKAEE